MAIVRAVVRDIVRAVVRGVLDSVGGGAIKGWAGLENCSASVTTYEIKFPDDITVSGGDYVSGWTFNRANSPIESIAPNSAVYDAGRKVVAFEVNFVNPNVFGDTLTADYLKADGSYKMGDAVAGEFEDLFEGTAGTEISVYNSAWSLSFVSDLVIAPSGTELTATGDFAASGIDTGAAQPTTVDFSLRVSTAPGIQNTTRIFFRAPIVGQSGNGAIRCTFDIATNEVMRMYMQVGGTDIGARVIIDAPIRSGYMFFTIADDGDGVTLTSHNNGETFTRTNTEIATAGGSATPTQFVGIDVAGLGAETFIDDFTATSLVVPDLEDTSIALANCALESANVIGAWTGLEDCYTPVFAKFDPTQQNYLKSAPFAGTAEANEGTILMWFNIPTGSANSKLFDIGEDSGVAGDFSTRARFADAGNIKVLLGNHIGGGTFQEVASLTVDVGVAWQYDVPNFLYLTYKNNTLDGNSLIQLGINGVLVGSAPFTIPAGTISFVQDHVVVIGGRHSQDSQFFDGELSEIWSTRKFLDHDTNVGDFINTAIQTVNFPNGVPIGRPQGEGVVGESPSNHFGGLDYSLNDWNAGKNNVDSNEYTLNGNALVLGTELEVETLNTVKFDKPVSYTSALNGVQIYTGEQARTRRTLHFNGDTYIDIPLVVDNIVGTNRRIEFTFKSDSNTTTTSIVNGALNLIRFQSRDTTIAQPMRGRVFFGSATDITETSDELLKTVTMGWNGGDLSADIIVNGGTPNAVTMDAGVQSESGLIIGRNNVGTALFKGIARDIKVYDSKAGGTGVLIHQWRIDDDNGSVIADTGEGNEPLIEATLTIGTGTWQDEVVSEDINNEFTADLVTGEGTDLLTYQSTVSGWGSPIGYNSIPNYQYTASTGDYTDGVTGLADQFIPLVNCLDFDLTNNFGAPQVIPPFPAGLKTVDDAVFNHETDGFTVNNYSVSLIDNTGSSTYSVVKLNSSGKYNVDFNLATEAVDISLANGYGGSTVTQIEVTSNKGVSKTSEQVSLAMTPFDAVLTASPSGGATGSLYKHLIEQMDIVVSAVTGTTDPEKRLLFTAWGGTVGAETLTRSTLNLGASLDLRGVNTHDDTAIYPFHLTNISKRHALYIAHGSITNGTSRSFEKTDGTFHTATIHSSTTIPNTDIRIVHFTADLDPLCVIYRTMPEFWEFDFIPSVRIFEDAYGGAVCDIPYFNMQSNNVYDGSGLKGTANISSIGSEIQSLAGDVIELSYRDPVETRFSDYYRLNTGGDSSSPSFFVVNGELILMNATFQPANSENLSFFTQEVNQIMNDQAVASGDPDAGSYALDSIDLEAEGFTKYTP